MHWLRTPKYLASIESTHISLLLVSLRSFLPHALPSSSSLYYHETFIFIRSIRLRQDSSSPSQLHIHSMKKNTRHSHRYWQEKGRKIHAYSTLIFFDEWENEREWWASVKCWLGGPGSMGRQWRLHIRQQWKFPFQSSFSFHSFFSFTPQLIVNFKAYWHTIIIDTKSPNETTLFRT